MSWTRSHNQYQKAVNILIENFISSLEDDSTSRDAAERMAVHICKFAFEGIEKIFGMTMMQIVIALLKLGKDDDFFALKDHSFRSMQLVLKHHAISSELKCYQSIEKFDVMMGRINDYRKFYIECLSDILSSEHTKA